MSRPAVYLLSILVLGALHPPPPATAAEARAFRPLTAPTIGDAALSVDGDIHLGDTSTFFKYDLLFLWDGANNLGLGRNALGNTTGSDNVGIGFEALLNNTTGERNTAVGFQALWSDSDTGSYGYGLDNTAVGYRALHDNRASAYYDGEAQQTIFLGSRNTAVGSAALSRNTTGRHNTGVGAHALRNNTTGRNNTAVGREALYSLTMGGSNTAIGELAMENVLSGDENLAIGRRALAGHPDGEASMYQSDFIENVAIGGSALEDFLGGESNIAVGDAALQALSTGNRNVALGGAALRGVQQGYSNNIGIGHFAGTAIILDNNILIGNEGVEDDANTIRLGRSSVETGGAAHTATYVAGIYPVTGDGSHYAVVDSTGQLSRGNALVSSARFKSAIRDMGGSSRGLFDLRPVTFRSELPAHRDEGRDFGLIAEEVAEVLPELVVYDAEGRPHGVRYNVLSSLLVNEVQRLHRQSRLQWALIAFLALGGGVLTVLLRRVMIA